MIEEFRGTIGDKLMGLISLHNECIRIGEYTLWLEIRNKETVWCIVNGCQDKKEISPDKFSKMLDEFWAKEF